MRALIYTRLSRRTDSNVLNIVDQLHRCREHAVSRGWTVVGELSDIDSAYDRDSLEDREGFAEAIERIRSGAVDVLLAWRPDRLWRDPVEAAIVMRTCVRGGCQMITTVVEGDRDPANPGDEMTSTIVAAVGRYESFAKSVRLRAKARQTAELGRVNGGMRPFGFEDDRVTHRRAEADLIVDGVRMVLEGLSLREVARVWSAAGATASAGGQVTSMFVRRTLLRGRIAGLREHHGRVVATAQWAPIVPVDDWHAVRAMLTDPARRAGTLNRSYLLTGGLAVCGQCGGTVPMRARPRTGGVRNYVCASGVNDVGCGKVTRNADRVEAYVVESLFAAIDLGAFDEPEQPPTSPIVQAELDEARARLEQLSQDHYVDGLIGRDEFFAAQRPLADRVARMEVLAARQPKRRPRRDLTTLRADWEHLTFDEQRAVVHDLIARVTILPMGRTRGTTRFDTSKIVVDFRA